MTDLDPGSYVRHSKLPDLGSGEVLECERGTVRVRFASGDRRFSLAHVGANLEIVQGAPPPPPTKAKKKRATKKR